MRSGSRPPRPPTTTCSSWSGKGTWSEARIPRAIPLSRAIRLTPTAAIRLGLSSELVPQSASADSRVVPIIGEIAAGGPIEAYQDASETMAVPDMLAPSGDAYVLKVRGDSMIEAHIADGDFVLIRPQTTARNGDIVVANVDDNGVTLKRFFKEKDKIRLQPANPAYPPQYYDDVRIQGKLDRRHPQTRLRAGGGMAGAGVAGLRCSLTHIRVRSLALLGRRLGREPSGHPILGTSRAPILSTRDSDVTWLRTSASETTGDIHRVRPQWAHRGWASRGCG